MAAIDKVIKELSQGGDMDQAGSDAMGTAFGTGVPGTPKTGDVGTFYPELAKGTEALIRKRLDRENLSPFVKNLLDETIPTIAKRIADREGYQILKRLRGSGDDE